MRARRQMSAWYSRAFVAVVLLLAGMGATWHAASGGGESAWGASASTTVSASVLSATSIDSSGCATGTAGVTAFGTMLPGNSTVTSAVCAVVFGSSNDSSMLLVSQADGFGRGMYMPSKGVTDPGFGAGGVVTKNVSAGDDVVYSVVIQPDGKTLVAGSATIGGQADFVLARYDLSGALDGSFGAGGVVTTNLLGNDVARDIALQPDGKIVVAGSQNQGVDEDWAVARYQANGALDTTFAGDGTFERNAPFDDNLNAVAVQPDGKVVVVGRKDVGGGGNWAVARLTQNGVYDTTFATGGIFTRSWGSGSGATDVAIQPDGKLVVAGLAWAGAATAYDFTLARLDSAGALDLSFDIDGITQLSTSPSEPSVDASETVAIQSDGKIVAGGYYSASGGYQETLVRYNSNGSLDAGFAGGGVLLGPVTLGNKNSRNIAVDAAGNIVFAVQESVAGSLLVERHRSDGALDPDFGISGQVRTTVGTGNNQAFAMALGPDGKVTVAGQASNGTNLDLALVRYGSNVLPDYAGASNDWTAGTSMFGACLESVAGGATTSGTTWSTTGSCTATNADPWRPIPPTAGSPGAKIAAAVATGTLTARANLRFGLRTAAAQPPGTYLAPVTFTVAAPNI